MTVQLGLRWLRRCWLAALALSAVAFYLGAVVGVRRFPYEVKDVIVITPTVEPGGVFRMARETDYQDDCDLKYDRRLQSLVPDDRGTCRREVLPDSHFDHPPWDLDEKPWSVGTRVPADFPRGQAKIVDSPSAARNWFQRIFWRQTRPDRDTFFKATGCPGPAG